MKNKNMAALCAVTFGLAGCASSSKDITASYVSPVLYQNLTCDQLSMEAMRVSGRAAEMTGQQDKKASGDSVKMGVGLILFWPSLLFIKGDGQTAAELGRLKGEMDAIQQASMMKNCGIQFEQAPPPPPKKVPKGRES